MSLNTVTGRILNVTTRQLGTSLTQAAAAGDTTLYVDDCGDFEDDGSGGWVSINDQVIQFDTVDDDASTIHLLTGLTAAADEGDPVYSWSTLYGQIDDEQTALVQVDGDTDLADPVHADIADSVGALADGLRGDAGETCTLTHLSPGVWEITAVGGRPSSVKSVRFEADDQHVLTAADVSAGSATISLSHRPIDESIVAVLGIPQRPTNYTVDYDGRTINWPLAGWEKAGDTIWVHYAYLGNGVKEIPWGATGWFYKVIGVADNTDYSAGGYDDSAWTIGKAAFGSDNGAGTDFDAWGGYSTPWATNTRIWLRRKISGKVKAATVWARLDNYADIYWNGTLIASWSHVDGALEDYDNPYSIQVPAAALGATNVIAVRATDPFTGGGVDKAVIDVRVRYS